MAILIRFSDKFVHRCSARYFSSHHYLEIEHEAVGQNPPLYYYESRRVVCIGS